MPIMTKTISAADIVFPNGALPTKPIAPAAAAEIDIDAVLHDVWRLLGERGQLNRNAQLVLAIKALIAAGVDKKGWLISAATRLGFGRAHAGAILSKSCGDDPERRQWRCSGGTFSLHPTGS